MLDISQTISTSIQSKNHNKSNLLSWKTGHKQNTTKRQEQLILLQNGQSIFFEQSTYKILMQNKIFAKMIGVGSSNKNISQFLAQPYIIDKFSTAFTVKHKILKYSEKSNNNGINQLNKTLNLESYKIFEYFVLVKEYYLLDGHKFGGDFLVYQNHPDSNHASFLLFVKIQGQNSQHISRLGGICKKQVLIASFEEQDHKNIQLKTQEVVPKTINEHKKNIASSFSTIQLALLKKMIGYT